MADVQTVARNATLEDLAQLLQEQQDLKVDAVVPAQAIKSVNGLWEVQGMRALGPAVLRPTDIADGQIAARLGIPPSYLKALRNGKSGKDGLTPRPDIYDININGWIHGTSGYAYPDGDEDGTVYNPDGRKFLVRSFLPADGDGIGRAIFSDRYAPIDNLDTLMSALEGINQSGVECEVVKCDLSETRMTVRFAAPGITALAPELLKGYRSPVGGWTPDSWRRHSGYEAGEEPIVFAGFQVSNSETGGAAFEVRPVITVKVCKNGLVVDLAKLRRVHLGHRLELGTINWSHETQQRQLALIKSQTTDAVKAFLSVDFLQGQVDAIERKAGVPLENPAEQVELVGKKLLWTEEQQKGILNHFLKGAQPTAGGLLNAVTSFAQVEESPDAAYDLESTALQVLDLVTA